MVDQEGDQQEGENQMMLRKGKLVFVQKGDFLPLFSVHCWKAAIEPPVFYFIFLYLRSIVDVIRDVSYNKNVQKKI